MGVGTSPCGSTPFGSTLNNSTAVFFVGNWMPQLGYEVHRLQFVEFDVVDRDDDFGVTLVSGLKVRAIQGGVVEDVWSAASGFAPRFYRGSGRVKISNGYHYVLRRTGGWLSHEVNIDVTAYNDDGELVRGNVDS